MIALKDISKSFSGRPVLQNVNATFNKGKCSFVIGASGGGKSVLMKCMVGLLSQDSGVIDFDGRDFLNLDYYKKKELIYTEGNNPNYLYLLQKGKIKTFRAHEYGKELIISLLKDGDFFGYTVLLDETPYNESAEALEDSSVVLIPKEDFYALLNMIFPYN